MSFEGGFKIDTDLLSGLPKSKNAWPIWLGDHYSKGNLTVMQIVKMLMERLVEEIQDSTDTVATYQEFKDAWDGFVKGSEFGDPMLFETMVFRAVPEFQASVEAKRAEKEQTE